MRGQPTNSGLAQGGSALKEKRQSNAVFLFKKKEKPPPNWENPPEPARTDHFSGPARGGGTESKEAILDLMSDTKGRPILFVFALNSK